MTRTTGARNLGVRLLPVLLALTLIAACSTTVEGRATTSDDARSAVDSSADASSGRTIAPPSASSSSSSSSSVPTSSGTPTTGTAGDSDGPDDSAVPDDHQRWLPREENPDPSMDIPGIYAGPSGLYRQRYHFAAPNRVAYDRFPPVGGPHDPVWATCDGVVYEKPVRNENMVHSLEHGAVWIAYNPATISAEDLTALRTLVPQVSYLVMTPYPDLDAPISLQSWAHQLKLDSATDPRLQEFLLALLRNPYITPEPNGTCAQPQFDVADPPPFDGTPPGPDAIPLDFAPPTESAPPTTG